MALALVVDVKKGMSAKQLQQHLGIGSYPTAWYMAHRIRKAMDMDETEYQEKTYLVGCPPGLTSLEAGSFLPT
jgi:hypothetical protein